MLARFVVMRPSALNRPSISFYSARLIALIPLVCRLFAAIAAGAQTGQWVWMGGSSSAGQAGIYGTLGSPATGNVPGARSNAVVWTDVNGNFWLQGGCGYDVNGHFGELNDLWKFDPSANEWTWVGGNNIAGEYTTQGGVYGTLRVPSSNNFPGSRNSAVSWTDKIHNFWMFGGNGFDANRYGGYSLLSRSRPSAFRREPTTLPKR